MDELEKHKQRDTERNVYVSTNEMLVEYRPFAELERWLRYRMAEKSEKKTKFIVTVTALFFLCGGPFIVLMGIRMLLSLIATGSTGAAADAVAASTTTMVTYFYAFLATLVASATVIYLSKPTHLSLSSEGLRLIWRHRLKGFPIVSARGPLLKWSAISRVIMEKPPGKPSPNDHLLTFRAGSYSAMKLRLGAFWLTEDRTRVLEGIERWAPQVPRDAEVIGVLEPPADYSYTELWMKALSAPPKRERLKPLLQGSFLREGKYRIEGPLGVGGQGTAYLAYDVGADNRTVVLKEFILPVYVDITVRKQALDRFEREAKILKHLDHPQVVKLIDFFVEDHRGYLVLEHIDGVSLRQLVEQEGSLSEERVREMSVQMCEILSYLHGLTVPVVHRDFTPDNLILRKDGTLKLVDFNVAQQTDATTTGTVVGKHSYLPPEQFRGQPSTRSDIYAMGATLFYLLTAQDPEPISQSDPREVTSSVSEELSKIVMRATAIDEIDRYQKAEEIRAALEQSGSPVKP